MTDRLVINPTEGTDPGVVPEGAEGDDRSVTIPDPANPQPPQQDDNQPTNEGDGEGRPEWLPEKFQSPEDLARAYTELEKKLGGQRKEDPPKQQQETEGAPTLDLPSLLKLGDDGKLTEESYAAFEKAGLGRDVADAVLASQQAAGSEYSQRVFESAGGQEAYQQMISWAKANMSEAEQSAFDRAVTSGDADLARMAVRGLRSAYVEANGEPPKLVQPKDQRRPTGIEPFRSDDEVVRAMSDPRYKTDEAYRQKVAQRLSVSEW